MSLKQDIETSQDNTNINIDTTSLHGNVKLNKNKKFYAYFNVIVGSVIYTLGLVWILELCGFFSGGVTGVAQLIVGCVNEFTEIENASKYFGYVFLAINIPLIILGSKTMSKRFAILTIISLAIQTILILVLTNFTISPFVTLLNDGKGLGDGLISAFKNGGLNIGLNETTKALQADFKQNMTTGTRLLLAIIGGLITGVGGSMCLKSGGSAGGTDIIANYVMLYRRKSFTQYQFIIDITIITLSALISVENVLYTIVRLVIYIKTVEVMYQIYNTIRVEIITVKPLEIREELLRNFYHGMTMYEVTGGYSMKSRKVIEVFVSSYEVPRYTQIIKQIDPEAFIVTSKVRLVRGNYTQKTIV